MMIIHEKLLPCPFCGGEAELLKGDPGLYSAENHLYHALKAVVCDQCISSSGWYLHEEEAIAAWNRRTPPAAVPDGWAIVPCEPDDEMTDKGESALIAGQLEKEFKDAPSATWAAAKACYRAMISAAPAAATEARDE